MLKNTIKFMLLAIISLFITACNENIMITGSNKALINTTQTYSVDIYDSYEWSVSPNAELTNVNSQSILFKASQIGKYTLSVVAKKDNKKYRASMIIDVLEPEVINGYELPLEPDETLNNSTILGIDSNDNGIRDDVERKAIKTYQEPIKVEPMLASLRIGQEILANPVGLAQEHSAKMDRVDNCTAYLRTAAPNLIDELEYIKFYEKNIYNTEERVRAYLDYNSALSGGVYGSGPADWTADKCDFEVEQMLEDRK